MLNGRSYVVDRSNHIHDQVMLHADIHSRYGVSFDDYLSIKFDFHIMPQTLLRSLCQLLPGGWNDAGSISAVIWCKTFVLWMLSLTIS